MNHSLPDWLFLWAAKALIGEVYPQIRAVSVGIDDKRKLHLCYILNEPPTEVDYERADEVLTNILANTSSNEEIAEVEIQCVCSKARLSSINPIGGWVYAESDYLDTMKQ